jgi:hypothetical protein
VRASDVTLATVPVELTVVDALLPDRTVAVAAGYDASAVHDSLGTGGEMQMWQLLHAHRIAPLHDAVKPDDLTRQRLALDGSLYTALMNYVGPAPALGDGIVAIGARSAFGEPDSRLVGSIEAIANGASRFHLFGSSEVFLDVSDETCSAGCVSGWRRLLAESDAGAPTLEIPDVRAAGEVGPLQPGANPSKSFWISGGVLPRTGTFLLDADAVSPRVNGWLQAAAGIPRWIVPEVAAWAGQEQTGDAEPFANPETLVTGKSVRWSNGGGVLVYPGLQAGEAKRHSAGVLPSIRLKNWRRGIEDAGYLQMARAKDRARADAVASRLLALPLADAGDAPAGWSRRGKPFFEARRDLLAIIQGQAPVEPTPAPAPVQQSSALQAGGSALGPGQYSGGVALVLGVGALIAMQAQRRQRKAAR